MASNEPQLNTELEDEVDAVNAIYGESTLTITSFSESYTTCLLKSEDGPFSWEIRFPTSYPAEPPYIVGIDSLWMSIGSKTKLATTKMQQLIDESFTPGQVCMFDVVNVLQVQARMEVPQNSVQEFVQTSSLSTSSKNPPRQLQDFADLESLAQCASCLDEYMTVDLVKLPCHHIFCPDCIQSMDIHPNGKTPYSFLYRWFPSVYGFQNIFHLLRKVGVSSNSGTILHLPRQNPEMVCRIPSRAGRYVSHLLLKPPLLTLSRFQDQRESRNGSIEVYALQADDVRALPKGWPFWSVQRRPSHQRAL
jgi:hypothetical protein